MNVLVVDDDPEMRDYVRRSLERGFGPATTVHEARDGEQALLLVDGLDRLDAVITDVLLPRLDGLALCGALEALASTRGLPVLVVSGELEAVERARARLAGRARRAFLAKPFNGASLCAALERLMEATRRGGPDLPGPPPGG